MSQQHVDTLTTLHGVVVVEPDSDEGFTASIEERHGRKIGSHGSTVGEAIGNLILGGYSDRVTAAIVLHCARIAFEAVLDHIVVSQEQAQLVLLHHLVEAERKTPRWTEDTSSILFNATGMKDRMRFWEFFVGPHIYRVWEDHKIQTR